ncbi:TniQ family protein [uncultured Bosea sp.]|uniref:TniQ family protein n=1 Tax=uncultured Bosea sp. TaxID=211457 RepID=UPI00345DB087
MSASAPKGDLHWTFKLRPKPDELLSSWLCRVAHAHGMTPHAFLALHWPGMEIWTRDIDRSADDGWLREVASRSGLPFDAVTALTLKPLMPILAGGRRRDFSRGDAPLVLSAGVFHRSRVRHALQFCPFCVAEEDPHVDFRREVTR